MRFNPAAPLKLFKNPPVFILFLVDSIHAVSDLRSPVDKTAT